MQIRTYSGIPNGAERAAKRIAASDKRTFGKTGRTAKNRSIGKKRNTGSDKLLHRFLRMRCDPANAPESLPGIGPERAFRTS